ncbi:hypothetical protein MTBPR1_190009 [Candidatus Terasakiella magnetica]|uniref:Uncharacterized protein n=1 Tax=Candidatus Terasakiella magnetica TaxID=1867952 RepID=A0A1C3RFV1_9PROT|nr:hypothetical protein [Candidatus Terasakiella magnetica]SCA56131.1 hypothetical protein MTBPR1_190009 [Candidatus Terasakiella magnetica]
MFHVINILRKSGLSELHAFAEKQKASAFWTGTITEAEKQHPYQDHVEKLRLFICDEEEESLALKAVEEDQVTVKKEYILTNHPRLQDIAQPSSKNPPIDWNTISGAEAEIARMGDSYQEWAKADLKRLQDRINIIKETNSFDLSDLDVMTEASYSIKSLGGSFDYHILTFLGDRLVTYLDTAKSKEGKLGKREIHVISAYVSAIKIVLLKQIKGDGGPMGQKLLENLKTVISGPRKETPTSLPKDTIKEEAPLAKTETQDSNAASQEELAKMFQKT